MNGRQFTWGIKNDPIFRFENRWFLRKHTDNLVRDVWLDPREEIKECGF